MKKIDIDAGDAFYNGGYFKRDNTVIDIYPIPHGRYKIVLSLHGNQIAIKENGFLTLNSCGYKTLTTKARLNAVLNHYGFNVSQKAGKWFLNGSIEFYDDIKIDLSNKKVTQ